MAELYWRGATSGVNAGNWNTASNWLEGSLSSNYTPILKAATRSPIGGDSVYYSDVVGVGWNISSSVYGFTGHRIGYSATMGPRGHFAVLSSCVTGGMQLVGNTYYWAGWTGTTGSGGTLGRTPLGQFYIRYGLASVGLSFIAAGVSGSISGITTTIPQDFAFLTATQTPAQYISIETGSNSRNSRNLSGPCVYGGTCSLHENPITTSIDIKNGYEMIANSLLNVVFFPNSSYYQTPPAGISNWTVLSHGNQWPNINFIGCIDQIRGQDFMPTVFGSGSTHGHLPQGKGLYGQLQVNSGSKINYAYLGGNPIDVVIEEGCTLGYISITPRLLGVNQFPNANYNILSSCGATTNNNAGASFSNPILVSGNSGGINSYKGIVFQRAIGSPYTIDGHTGSSSYFINIGIPSASISGATQNNMISYNLMEMDVLSTANTNEIARVQAVGPVFINDITLEDSAFSIVNGINPTDRVLIKKGTLKGYSSIDMRKPSIGITGAALVLGPASVNTGASGAAGILKLSSESSFIPHSQTTTVF